MSAESLEAEAIRQRDTVKRNLYMADIRLAAADLYNSNIPRLHRKLDEHIPTSGSIDYRSWEWYYLQAASHLEQRTFYGHTDRVEDVDWNPDGQYIASTGYDGVRIWNAKSGSVVYKNNDGPTIKRCAAWSPDGSRFVWGSAFPECAIRIWEMKSGEVYILSGHTFSIDSICWSPDGKQIASTQGSSCRIWDSEKRECVTLIGEGIAQLNNVTWNPKRDILATSRVGIIDSTTRLSAVTIWNPKNGEQITQLLQDTLSESVAFTPDGDKLIVGDIAGRIRIYDVSHWELLLDFAAHQARVSDTSVNPVNSSFASCGADGILHLWSLIDGKKLLTLNGHDAAVNSVAWDPTGASLVSGGSDHNIKTWNVAECSAHKCLSMESKKSSALEWDSSSERIIICCEDGTVELMDINSSVVEGVPIQSFWIDKRVLPDDDAIAEYIERSVHKNAIKPFQFLSKWSKENLAIDYGFSWSSDGKRLVTVIKELTPANSIDPWKITVWDTDDARRMHQ